MSLFSLLVDLFVLLMVVGLVALVVKLRNVAGVRLNLALLLIVGVLVMTVLALGKLVAIMLGVILLFSISFSLLFTRRMRESSEGR
jgi:Ca2+/Na+ antiporter